MAIFLLRQYRFRMRQIPQFFSREQLGFFDLGEGTIQLTIYLVTVALPFQHFILTIYVLDMKIFSFNRFYF